MEQGQILKFNDWIKVSGNYAKIEEMCKKHCLRYNSVNYTDVLSFIMEVFVRRNPEIRKESEFFGGWVSKEIKWEISKLLTARKTSEIKPNLREPEKEECEIAVKIEEKIVKKLKNTQYWDFYYDKYILKMKEKELADKYKTTKKSVAYKSKKIREILKGVVKIKEKYEGIAMLKDGKIERVFPDYNSVVIIKLILMQVLNGN
jgi:hypothetical protein